jgi:hypothetical protein
MRMRHVQNRFSEGNAKGAPPPKAGADRVVHHRVEAVAVRVREHRPPVRQEVLRRHARVSVVVDVEVGDEVERQAGDDAVAAERGDQPAPDIRVGLARVPPHVPVRGDELERADQLGRARERPRLASGRVAARGAVRAGGDAAGDGGLRQAPTG